MRMTWLALIYDKQNNDAVLTFEKFYHFSGLKVSYHKTVILLVKELYCNP